VSSCFFASTDLALFLLLVDSGFTDRRYLDKHAAERKLIGRCTMDPSTVEPVDEVCCKQLFFFLYKSNNIRKL
jgi:hypothetical protein